MKLGNSSKVKVYVWDNIIWVPEYVGSINDGAEKQWIRPSWKKLVRGCIRPAKFLLKNNSEINQKFWEY